MTVLNQTPSAFYQLASADAERRGRTAGLRYVIFGGEALDLWRLAEWYDRHGDDRPVLVNMYGITETTVHVTYFAAGPRDGRDRHRQHHRRADPGPAGLRARPRPRSPCRRAWPASCTWPAPGWRAAT